MKPLLLSLALLLVAGGTASARDSFDAVHCGRYIPGVLIGHRMPQGRVVAIEGRHKDIGLRDLGADEISDRLQSISWLVCGEEVMLLVDRQDIVRAALTFPPHGPSLPEFGGVCRLDDRTSPDMFVGLLNNPAPPSAGMHYLPGDDTMLRPSFAWRIDEQKPQFVPVDSNRLLCPRSTIVTRDGGP